MHLVKKAESIPEDMPFLEFKKLFSETKHLVVMKDIGTSKIIASTPADDRNSVLKNLP